jgi:anhydro-N-acetylmuramic acid kinase
MDGLDMAFCRFEVHDGKWQYAILKAETAIYSDIWIKKIIAASDMSALDFAQLHVDYGHYIGKLVKGFMDNHNIRPDYIASHGQTIMHQPQHKLTVQIGSGAAIAAECGVNVVCDFRTTDVALGGQGAPLVPIGDKLLFGDFDACLNIGGFANISFNQGDRRIAYDICPANTILNFLAQNVGMEYDRDGKMAEGGRVSDELLRELNQIGYYSQNPPKSLGMEWMKHVYEPLEKYSNLSIADQLRTLTEHIAQQIAFAITDSGTKNTLSTGGGSHNKFLINRINDLSGNSIEVPSDEIIDYKEALIFALLGVLRMRNEVNCLSSVTGAVRDSCGGAIY